MQHMASEEDAARLQHELVGFVRAFGLLSQERTPCGQPMAPSDAHALTEIADGGRTQRELVDRLRLDRSSVSRLVDRLVTRGWVERVDAADRRTVRLVATAQGERVAAEVAASRSDRFAVLLDAIQPDQRALVLDALRLLTAAARSERGETA
jgi:DNA-binding MarR family transcriptional regulator